MRANSHNHTYLAQPRAHTPNGYAVIRPQRQGRGGEGRRTTPAPCRGSGARRRSPEDVDVGLQLLGALLAVLLPRLSPPARALDDVTKSQTATRSKTAMTNPNGPPPL